MLSQSHHLARTRRAAAARDVARPGRGCRLARTCAAAVAAAALLASACSTEEPPAPPAAEETTTTATAAPAAPAGTAAPAVTSPCNDPEAQDLGGGHYARDGRRYELTDGHCLPRFDRPDDTPDPDGALDPADTASGDTAVSAPPDPEQACIDDVCLDMPVDSSAQPIPEQMLAEGTVPEGENFVVVEVLQSEDESQPDDDREDVPAPTTSALVEQPPTTAPEPEPEQPDPPTTTAPAEQPETPTSTTEPDGDESEDGQDDDTPPSVAATIHRSDYCELLDGTWNPSTSECESWTRVIPPLPEPVGDPVTVVTDEDDSFVSGSGRRVVRTEPAAIQVGTVLGQYEDGSIASIITEIESLGSGWWQVVVCAIHESFVLPEVGNEGWQFVAYAWQEADGRFRIEQDNWGPGDDGPC